MNKIDLRKKIRNNLNHIIILIAHPKLSYTWEFKDDKLIVNYNTIDGKLVTSNEFTLDDYGKKWDFEEPDVDDSLNDVDITATELIEITKLAEDEKYSKHKQAVIECVNDIKEDVARNIRSAAMNCKYSYTSQVNIKIRRYIKERSLCEEFEKDFANTVYMRLCEFYNPKGFNISLDKSYAETTLAVLIWDLSSGEAKDEFIQPSLQSNKDLNELFKDAEQIQSSPFRYLEPAFETPHHEFIKAEGLHQDLACPYCGARYYEEKGTINSLVYTPRIYKDGILVDTPNPNWSITHFHCLVCGKDFETKNGKVLKIDNVVTTQGGEINENTCNKI